MMGSNPFGNTTIPLGNLACKSMDKPDSNKLHGETGQLSSYVTSSNSFRDETNLTYVPKNQNQPIQSMSASRSISQTIKNDEKRTQQEANLTLDKQSMAEGMKPVAREEPKLKKKKKIEEYKDEASSSRELSDIESEFEDDAYIPNNRRIKKSIESTPKRVLRDRIQPPSPMKETTDSIQKKLADLIAELEILLEYKDIDIKKLTELFHKVDRDPSKIITKVKRSRTYYKKYFKLEKQE